MGRKLEYGDQVIVYQSRESVDSITLTAGQIFQSRFGHYKHDDLLGKDYGSKVSSGNGKGFVYVLLPTPELWTLALPHRTQILYLPDIAFITSYLDVKPGSRVIEAGTGSGSFSHSLARSVGTTGKVYSYEYNEERFTKARAEFASHSLSSIIHLRHSNVYKDGFMITDEADSVFLDLPAPWDAVDLAKQAMRKDRQSRICCFSPCIEQVLRTVERLSECGFSDITMFETLTRTHDPANLVAPSITTAIDRIRGVEAKKERRRETQIEESKRRKETKRLEALKEAEAGTGTETESEAAGTDGDADEPPSKRVKVDGEARGSNGHHAAVPPPPVPPTPPTSEPIRIKSPPAETSNSTADSKVPTFKAGPQSRGHTSYLTFATLLPAVAAVLETSSREEVTTEEVGRVEAVFAGAEVVATKPDETDVMVT